MKQDQHITQSLLSEDQTSSQNSLTFQKNRNKCINSTIDGKGWFSNLFFTWVLPLLSFGNKNMIEVDIIPKLPQNQATSIQFNRFQKIWSNIQKSQKQGFTLIRALIKTFKKQWIILAILVVITTAIFIVTPGLTALTIDYLTNQQDDVSYGIFLFFVTFLLNVVQRAFFSQYFYRFVSLGIKLSNLVTMIVYDKALKYTPLSHKQFSEAEIINYSQVDAQRLVGVGQKMAALFYGPLQIIFAFILLYLLLGLAIFASIGIIILVLVISYFLSKITIRLNEQVLKAKDERMKVSEQMLQIIRFIKISAIQKFFFRKLDAKRLNQVKIMIKRGLNFVAIVGLIYFTCPMLVTGSYLLYILLGFQISPKVAFTTMTVVTLFEYPMYSLPTAISQLIQILTSLKRIEKFLNVKNINYDHIQYSDKNQFALEIYGGNFYWKREQKEKKQDEQESKKQFLTDKEMPNQKQVEKVVEIQEQESEIVDTEQENDDLKQFKVKDQKGKALYVHVLKDINLKILKGTFTMIFGDIGSGKSSLLLAIINQLITAKSSKIMQSGDLAYSPQKPWIMSSTLKENITFTLPLKEDKLKNVIHYACLEEDIKMLPNGIETEIGEKGVNISGGQKARVSLARALYSQKQIYLLDDILSAVDVHVGDFIVKKTVRQFLKGKTVIMPTHAIKLAPLADQIIIMKRGRIVRKGSYRDIQKTAQFEEVSEKEHQKQQKEAKQQIEDKEDLQSEIAKISDVLRNRTKSANSRQGLDAPQKNDIIEQLILPQDHKEGTIDSIVISNFIKLNGGYFKFVLVLVLVVLGYVASKTMGSIVIQLWCQNPSDQDYEVYIFMGLNLLSIIFVALMAYVLVISGGNQSIVVHKNVILGLLYASLGSFYNRVPIGRIINRLTKDLRQLDEAIMQSLLFFLINLTELLGILVICIYTTTPLTLIPMVIVAFFSNKVRKYYLKTQRQVCRYEKSTNSPVVSGFLSTISGLSTLRAYKKEVQFTQMQYKLFDNNKRVRLTKIGLQNWFANALAYMSFLINMPCIAYCMFNKGSDPATMGLLMSYAINLSYNIVGLTLSQADVQTKLTSLQRVYKFMEIQPQPKYIQYCKNWSPEQEGGVKAILHGSLEFKQLKVRYRKDLPDVIKGINCKIEPGEKIGIVGRTGAGKTTIINTLLGVTQISSGNIIIDGKPIDQFPLKNLRYSITMIDQQPTLIKSTFRENLDITNSYSDSQLYQILKECNLYQIIQEKGGLDGAVSNTSLSAGEKQLLCICRAFLKQSKIVLVDEATANIDVRNDAIIQKVIAEKFKQSTVLTIAHRLSTLKNSDKIMVMEKGQLVQFGNPDELQNRLGGVYSQMIKSHQKDMLN